MAKARPEPLAPLALWALVQIAALMMSAWGWRWSHAWPTTPGAGALPVIAATQVILGVLLAPAMLSSVTGLLIACGLAAIFQMAAVTIQPSPLPMVPWSVGWVVLWLGGLWLMRWGTGGWADIASAGILILIALEACAIWMDAAGSWKWPRWVESASGIGPITAVISLTGSGKPDQAAAGWSVWVVPVLVAFSGPITATLRRGRHDKGVSAVNPHPVADRG